MNLKIKIGIGVGALLLLLALGFGYFKYYDSTYSQSSIFLQDRQEFEKQIADFKEQEKDLTLQSSIDDYFRVYSGLAKAYNSLGQNQDAIDALDKAKGKAAANPKLWELYAKIYADMGNWDQAIQSSKMAILVGKGGATYWRTYLDLLQKKDPTVDVSNAYDSALAKTNNNIDIILLYARYLESKGFKDRAIQMWQKATEVDPEFRADYENQIKRIQG